MYKSLKRRKTVRGKSTPRIGGQTSSVNNKDSPDSSTIFLNKDESSHSKRDQSMSDISRSDFKRKDDQIAIIKYSEGMK